MRKINENVDYGLDIEIPIEIYETYFNKLFDALADRIFNSVGGCTEDEAEEFVYEKLIEIMGCSPKVLDHIMHGEYVIIK